MNIAIIGFAREGQAAYEYWNRDSHELTICDQNKATAIPKGAHAQLGADYLKNLGQFDLIIRTAGLHPRQIADANPETPDILRRVMTSANELLHVCPSRNIIGVTGTKGKGTTSVLISKILEAAGYRTYLAGNMGIPPLKLLEKDIKPDDWVVLELSSFQLIDITASPHIAVCLMINEEHLNWHADYKEYVTAKQQLFRWQRPEDIAIYYGPDADSKSVASASSGKHIPYMQAPGAEVLHDDRIVIDGQPICHVSEIKLLGKHNWQNVCAAVAAVWQITHDVAAIRKAVINFEPLPHRLELVRETGGVSYYNDSFSSAPPAAMAAIDAVPGRKIMIIGGQDRGLNLSELAETISAHTNNIRKIMIIGEAAPRIEKALSAQGFTDYKRLQHTTMPDIVAKAQHIAQAGDSVVLSPGFPSFDMFKDFEDRGEQFKAAVNDL